MKERKRKRERNSVAPGSTTGIGCLQKIFSGNSMDEEKKNYENCFKRTRVDKWNKYKCWHEFIDNIVIIIWGFLIELILNLF